MTGGYGTGSHGSWPSVVVLLSLIVVAGCRAAEPAAAVVEETRMAMGSSLRVAIWTADENGARAAIEAVFREFDRLETLLSIWRPGSDVQRLNAAAGHGPLPVGADTLAVLQAASDASRLTQGKFDITFGALSDVWRFDHDQDNRIPSAAEIAARLPLVDYTAINVDPAAGTAEILRPGVRIHLGGIGKGYAVDRAVALLRSTGLTDFLLQAGGDLYAAGRRGSRSWRVGLQDPRGEGDSTFATVDVRDETFSTSGDYERFFIADGVRYHHLLDPDTGRPAAGCRSVTVLAKSAMVADWASTGTFILGPEAGMALLEALPEVEGVIVTRNNEVRASSGLQGRLIIERPPTP